MSWKLLFKLDVNSFPEGDIMHLTTFYIFVTFLYSGLSIFSWNKNT